MCFVEFVSRYCEIAITKIREGYHDHARSSNHILGLILQHWKSEPLPSQCSLGFLLSQMLDLSTDMCSRVQLPADVVKYEVYSKYQDISRYTSSFPYPRKY